MVPSGVVFFFQAEDGIRDADVTGVQTCALPILPMLTRVPPLGVPDAGNAGAPTTRASAATRNATLGTRMGPPLGDDNVPQPGKYDREEPGACATLRSNSQIGAEHA